MNLTNGKGSMSTASSIVTWKAGDVVTDQFPAGLRVLVVVDDSSCLLVLEKMLLSCHYEVTKCNRAESALSLLLEDNKKYDIVLSDVHLPDMDGFKLLDHIGLEIDLPVIMMSCDGGKSVVMKGVTHGACDYLIKPVGMKTLKNIWQNVIRKRRDGRKDMEQSGRIEEGNGQQKQSEDADYSSLANEGNWRNSKKRKDGEEAGGERDDTSTMKKPRVVWSVELHQQFIAAVSQLGIEKAVPKKILELMNVPGLTRENVASHLQKYRLYLRRGPQRQNSLNNGFVCPQEATYGPLSSPNGLDLQTLAATGQLPSRSHATLHAAGLGRAAAKSRIPMPIVDQTNLLSFENSKLIFGEGQQQQLSSSKPMNLLLGVPTTMEPEQLLHHSVQCGSMNVQVNAHGGQGGQSNSLLMQASQSRSWVRTLNETTGSLVPMLTPSTTQPVLSNPVVNGVLAENGRSAGYNLVPQSPSMLNFPLNSAAELSGISFPLGCAPGISSLTSRGAFQEEVNSEIKVSVMPSYDIFSDLNQQKSLDWELGMTFHASQQNNSLQNDLEMGPSLLSYQGFSSSQRTGQNRNMSDVGNPMFTAGDASEHVNAQNFGHANAFFSDNSVRAKSEIVSDANCQTNLFPEQFIQEDLMGTLLEQGVFSP